MATLMERFREKTARWVKAPSGIEYEVCGLTMAQGNDALDAMFEIAQPLPGDATRTGEALEAAPNTPEEIAAIKKRLLLMARAGVLAMRFDGEEQRPALSPDHFPAGDLPFICQKINETGEPSEELKDEARRALPE